MPSRTLTSRRRAYRFGLLAEGLCILHLFLHNYRLLAWRVRTPRGEIDLIARHGPVIVFIEVKARPDNEQAAFALGARQRTRLSEAAEVWLASHAKYAGLDARFDLMLVTPWRWPRHIVNAWHAQS